MGSVDDEFFGDFGVFVFGGFFLWYFKKERFSLLFYVIIFYFFVMMVDWVNSKVMVILGGDGDDEVGYEYMYSDGSYCDCWGEV